MEERDERVYTENEKLSWSTAAPYKAMLLLWGPTLCVAQRM